ncbi:hypothetical protein CCACVL1_05488, partial [Corchorus capsularis]
FSDSVGHAFYEGDDGAYNLIPIQEDSFE